MIEQRPREDWGDNDAWREAETKRGQGYDDNLAKQRQGLDSTEPKKNPPKTAPDDLEFLARFDVFKKKANEAQKKAEKKEKQSKDPQDNLFH